ncbi:MAG TPA: hypothetical protein VHO48_10680 [Anaerolineaceae bacterium]|nr:hypothetical protein [Anaerolineaceae bacterium]
MSEEKAWSAEEIQAPDNDGKMVDYSGGLLNTLLAEANPATDATLLTAVAGDGEFDRYN